jgi:hypothetical protein
VVVTFTLRNGTATAGADYIAGGGTITIPPGALSAVAEIALLDDGLSEGPESVRFVIEGIENAESESSEVVLTIVDDEPLPGLAVAVRIEAVEGATVSVPVTLTGLAALPVEFEWAWASGSATQPADLPTLTGSVRFLPGERSASLEVVLPDDASDEPVEVGHLVWRGIVHAGPGPFVTEFVISDNDPRPVAHIGDLVVAEADGVARFPVALAEPSGWEITLQFVVAGDSAAAADDFLPAAGTLVIPPGSAEAVWEIRLVDDFVSEPEEEFKVEIGLVRNVRLEVARARVRIVDDDPPDALTVRAAPTSEGDGRVQIDFLRSTLSERVTRLHYELVPGTAAFPGDYEELGGDVEIPAGAWTASIQVPVSEDVLDEDDEAFGIAVTPYGPETPLVVGAPFEVVIVDDDPAPEVRVDSATAVEGDGMVEIRVWLAPASGREISGVLVPAGGEAVPGIDYSPLDEPFVFAPGETERSVIWGIADDGVAERTERAGLAFRDLVNAGAPGHTAELVIDDNEAVPEEGVISAGGGGEIRWIGQEGGRYGFEWSAWLVDWQPSDSGSAASGFWQTLAWPRDESGVPRRFVRLRRLDVGQGPDP